MNGNRHRPFLPYIPKHPVVLFWLPLVWPVSIGTAFAAQAGCCPRLAEAAPAPRPPADRRRQRQALALRHAGLEWERLPRVSRPGPPAFASEDGVLPASVLLAAPAAPAAPGLRPDPGALVVEDYETDAYPEFLGGTGEGWEAFPGWTVPGWEGVDPVVWSLEPLAEPAPGSGSGQDAGFAPKVRALRITVAPGAPAAGKAALELVLPSATDSRLAPFPALTEDLRATGGRQGRFESVSLAAANPGTAPLRLAVAVTVATRGGDAYFESPPGLLPAGAGPETIAWEGSRPYWKSLAGGWRHQETVPAGPVRRLALLVYAPPPRPDGPAPLWIHGLRLAGNE